MLRCLRKPTWLLRFASDTPAFGDGERLRNKLSGKQPSPETLNSDVMTGRELVSLLQTAKIMPSAQSKMVQDNVMKRVKELYSTWDLDRTQLCNLLLKSADLSHSLMAYLKGLVTNDLQDPRSPFSHSELVSVLRFIQQSASRDNGYILGELMKRLEVVPITRMDLACHSAMLLRQVKQFYVPHELPRSYERFKEYILANENSISESDLLQLIDGFCAVKWTEFGFEELLERKITKLCEGEVSPEMSVGMLNYLVSLRSVRTVPAKLTNSIIEKVEKGIESGQIREKHLELILFTCAIAGMKFRPELLETIATNLELSKVSSLSLLALAKLRTDSGIAEPYSSLSKMKDFGFSKLFGQRGLLQALVLLQMLPAHPVPTALLEKINSHLTNIKYPEEIATFFKRIHSFLRRQQVTPQHLRVLFPILPQLLSNSLVNTVIDPSANILLWFSKDLEAQFEPVVNSHMGFLKTVSLDSWSKAYFDTGRIQDYFRVYRMMWPRVSLFSMLHMLRFVTEETSSAEIVYLIEMIMKVPGKMFPVIGKSFALDTALEMMEKYPFVTGNLQKRIAVDLQSVIYIKSYASGFLRLYACLNRINRINRTAPCEVKPSLHPLITGKDLTYLANIANNQNWARDVVQGTNWDPSAVQLTRDMSKLEVRELFLNLLQSSMKHNASLLQALSSNFTNLLRELPLRTAAQWLLPVARISDRRLEMLKVDCIQSLMKRLIEAPYADFDTKFDFLPLFSYIQASLKDIDFVVEEVLRAFPYLSLSGKCEVATRLGAIGVETPSPYTECITAVLKNDNLTLRYAPQLIESMHNADIIDLPKSAELIDKYLSLALANNAELLNEIDFARVSLGILNHFEFSRWRGAVAGVDKRFWGELNVLKEYTLSCALSIPHDFGQLRYRLCEMMSRPLPDTVMNVLREEGIRFEEVNRGMNVYLPNYLPDHRISLWNPHLQSRLPYTGKVNGDLILLGKLIARQKAKRCIIPQHILDEASAKKWLSAIIKLSY